MITQLPRTSKGQDRNVMFVDQLSKMSRLKPMSSMLDSTGFANRVSQYIYPHYGHPLRCSDRGTQWNITVFPNIYAHFNITLRLTLSYHPRANGQTDRMN